MLSFERNLILNWTTLDNMIITEFSLVHSLKMKLCFFKAVNLTVNSSYVLNFTQCAVLSSSHANCCYR